MHLLEVLNVSRAENGTTVLHPISFSLDKGDKLAIAGSTGSGKTTLLKLIGGLLQPESGSVFYEGKRVPGPKEQLFPGHKYIAYLSQHFELRNNYYVYQLLEILSKVQQDEANKIYRICRIDHLLQRKTNQLSGGERQRIALAAALTTKPKVLLLDEPFSNADMQHKMLLKAVLNEVNNQLGTALILVSHDALDILPWADQLMILQEGRLVQKGSPKEVYQQPKDEYVAGLTGYYNLVTPFIARSLNISSGSSTELTIIRPEQLSLNSDRKGIKGIITSIDFMGTYYLIHLSVDGEHLTVMSMNTNYRTKQEVYIQFQKTTRDLFNTN